MGLKSNLKNIESFLKSCGLEVNSGKSFAISFRFVPKEKNSTILTKGQSFEIGGTCIKQLSRFDSFQYLGVRFTAEKRQKTNVTEQTKDRLEKINKAPLKPIQRLYGLRTFIIPDVFHALVLANVSIRILNKLEKMVRGAARKWFHLHHDVPNAYIHSDVKDGGLGITSLRTVIPFLRLKRLELLREE